VPIQLSGYYWHVFITEQKIKIGCQVHAIGEWQDFDDKEIESMHPKALDFWRQNKTIIMALANSHKI